MPISSCPNSRTEPASAVRSPVPRLNSVVLPAPLGPMISRRSPGMTESETSLVAGKPPKRLLRCATSSAGVVIRLAGLDAVLQSPPRLRATRDQTIWHEHDHDYEDDAEQRVPALDIG